MFNLASSRVDSLVQSINSSSHKKIIEIIKDEDLSLLSNQELNEFDNAINSKAESFLDIEKAELFGELSFAYFNISNFKKSYKSLNNLKKLLPHIENTENFILFSFKFNRVMALCLLSESKFEESLNYFLLEKEFADKADDVSRLIDSYDDLGLYHYKIGDYENSIINWEESLELNKEYYDSSDWSATLGNLGYLYTLTNKYNKAEEVLTTSLKIALKNDDKVVINNCYTNLGIFYHKQKEFKNALYYIKKSHNLIEQIGNPSDVTSSHLNLAVVLDDNGEKKMAEYHHFKGLQLSRELNSLPLIKTSYLNLADKYYNDKKYKLAYCYVDSAWNINDSILNTDRIKVLAEMENKYLGQRQKDSLNIALQDVELSKKEIELSRKQESIAKRDKDEEKKKGYVILIISGVCLLAAGGVISLILRNNKTRRIANKVLSQKNKIIEEKNKDITDSIKYAQKLQSAVLPPREKLALSFKKFMLFYQPRDIVSGDFYWFHENESYTYLAAADCTGHGVPGAMVSMLCTSQLSRNIQSDPSLSSGELLTAVNIGILKILQSGEGENNSTDGMDLTLIRLNKENGEVDYAGAMNKIVVVRGKDTFDFNGDRVSIGGYTNVSHNFKTNSLELEKDDVVFMFSDGFQDQFGGVRNKKFRLKPLKKLFVEISKMSPEKQEEMLNKELTVWQRNFERIDDVLVLGFTY